MFVRGVALRSRMTQKNFIFGIKVRLLLRLSHHFAICKVSRYICRVFIVKLILLTGTNAYKLVFKITDLLRAYANQYI